MVYGREPQRQKMLPEEDASFLLPDQRGRHIKISLLDQAYSLKSEAEENWVWHAFKAMRAIDERRRGQVDTFAAVGTGPGLDAIGASTIFTSLKRIIITDVRHDILDVAVSNVRRNISSDVAVFGDVGDLCEPLMARGRKADVVYANLPTIPADSASATSDPGSFYSRSLDEDSPRHLADLGLSLQYKFLLSARSVLSPRGSVLVMLGLRFPLEAVTSLMRATGYSVSSITASFKRQSEIDVAANRYALMEEHAEFDFYLYREAMQRYTTMAASTPPETLREELLPFRISAREALAQRRKGREIGHILCAIDAAASTAAWPQPWTE